MDTIIHHYHSENDGCYLWFFFIVGGIVFFVKGIYELLENWYQTNVAQLVEKSTNTIEIILGGVLILFGIFGFFVVLIYAIRAIRYLIKRINHEPYNPKFSALACTSLTFIAFFGTFGAVYVISKFFPPFRTWIDQQVSTLLIYLNSNIANFTKLIMIFALIATIAILAKIIKLERRK